MNAFKAHSELSSVKATGRRPRKNRTHLRNVRKGEQVHGLNVGEKGGREAINNDGGRQRVKGVRVNAIAHTRIDGKLIDQQMRSRLGQTGISFQGRDPRVQVLIH